MNRKRLFIYVLCGVLMIGYLYYEYASHPVYKGQKTIGATYMTMNNDFYKIINEEIEKAADLHGDVVYARDAMLDSQSQVAQIYDFVAKECDAIIINPVEANSQELNAALSFAHSRGIKIVAVDSQLTDTSAIDCTIVSDNYEAGCQCARDMMAIMKKATILLLEHQSAMSAVDRIKGFEDTIKTHDSYQIVDRRDCQGQTENALSVVDDVVRDGIRFDVIMALNDPSALGAIASIKKNQLSYAPVVYGVDGSPDVKKLIASTDEIRGTSAQTPVTMGQEAIETAYQMLAGEAVEETVTIPVFMITKDNIDQYLVAGWQ